MIRHMTTTPLRAAIYTRISQVVEDVDKTANQEAEVRELATASGYEVVEVFEDDDISAYKGKAERPSYVSMLAGLRDGRFDVIMATEPQRLTRGSAVELEALHIELVRAGAVLHTRAAGVQNPATPTVAAMMQIQDVIGGLEVAIKTERQIARNRADRSKGLPPKGVRPFGWEAQRVPLSAERAAELGWTLSPAEATDGAFYLPVREAEAEIIRAAYKAVMDDAVTLWGLARRWTAAGVKTDAMAGVKADGTQRKPRKDRMRPGETKPVPAVWVASTVRQVLTRPRNAGILVSAGVEMPVSRIQPIVNREEFEALGAELKRRAKLVAPEPGVKPSYMLGGVLECACGERMHATISYSQRKDGVRHRYQVYKCRNAATDKAQKHSAIQLPIAEDAVTVRVLQRIAQGGLKGLDDDKTSDALSDIADRMAKNSKSIEHLRGLIADPDLNEDAPHYKGQLKARHAERKLLEAERDAVQAQRAEGGALAEFVDLWESIPDLAHSQEGEEATGIEILSFVGGFMAWHELTIEKQREIVRGLFRVRVQLGGRGAERLQFTPVSPLSAS